MKKIKKKFKKLKKKTKIDLFCCPFLSRFVLFLKFYATRKIFV